MGKPILDIEVPEDPFEFWEIPGNVARLWQRIQPGDYVTGYYQNSDMRTIGQSPMKFQGILSESVGGYRVSEEPGMKKSIQISVPADVFEYWELPTNEPGLHSIIKAGDYVVGYFQNQQMREEKRPPVLFKGVVAEAFTGWQLGALFLVGESYIVTSVERPLMRLPDNVLVLKTGSEVWAWDPQSGLWVDVTGRHYPKADETLRRYLTDRDWETVVYGGGDGVVRCETFPLGEVVR